MKEFEQMDYEFSRTESLLGKEGMWRLANSRVAVFGLGGVGSWAAEALARSGVGHLVLVDYDTICVTNINRQVHATHKTLGQPKVTVMKSRITEINPQAQVEVYPAFYAPECTVELVRADYDYIIDAIDTVSSKIELIIKAQGHNIPIISSMGTGNKLDPSCLEIADIYETSVCPLARVMRRELRKRNVKSLTVVYSREQPLKPVVSPGRPQGSSESGQEEASPGRIAPGSTAFVPPAAGLLIASRVVRDLVAKGSH